MQSTDTKAKRPEMRKIVERKIKPRTRRNERADGSASITWDVVGHYRLDCDHVERRTHTHEGAASKVGARLKCKQCTKAAST